MALLLHRRNDIAAENQIGYELPSELPIANQDILLSFEQHLAEETNYKKFVSIITTIFFLKYFLY